jgi:predicted GNAT family N-acyltransferase
MAVLKDRRGRGIGSAMLRVLVEKAQSRGAREVLLSAQVQAIEFYRAHGFVEEGTEYLEAGILHRDMRRRL